MLPHLRSDLSIERTEQSGQVQYLVTEPSQGRSYRLYEVEYLIAKMFDGQTEPQKVLSRAQSELGFDASEDDFQRFIEQLIELGFVYGGAAPSGAASTEAPSEAMFNNHAGSTMEHEKERLVRSGVLHIKQGLFGQARDHFLAAKKSDPTDGKIAVMLNHFDVVGDDNGPSELEYLWKQTSNQYPELCAEIGAPGDGVAPIPVEDEAGRERAVRRPSRQSWVTVGVSALCLALLVVVGLGVRSILFPPQKQVTLDRVRTQKTNVYFSVQAVERAPKRQWSLKFGKPGTVTELVAKTGETVKAGKIVARLQLPAAQEKAFKVAHAQRLTLEKTFIALSLQVERDLAIVNDKQAAVQVLKANLESARTAGQRREAAAFEKRIVLANKELAKLRAQTLKPRQLKDKIDKQVKAAVQAEDKLVAASEWAFLRAPQDAVVAKVDFRLGGKASEASELLLVDRSALHLTFTGNDVRLQGAQKGGGAKVTTGLGSVVTGTLLDLQPNKFVVEVGTSLEEFAKGEVGDIRWLKETVNDALVVPASAKQGEDWLWTVSGGRAYKQKVVWLDARGKDAFIRSGVKTGDLVIAGPEDIWPALQEGDHVVAQEAVVP